MKVSTVMLIDLFMLVFGVHIILNIIPYERETLTHINAFSDSLQLELMKFETLKNVNFTKTVITVERLLVELQI